MNRKDIPRPCFLLEEEKLERNLKLVRSVRKAAGVQIILAFKAFAFWPSFDVIRRYLDGATASSLWEAKLCEEEMKCQAHSYSPVYLPEDIDEILELSSHITFNSLNEVKRYGAKAKAKGVSIGLRVNPGHSVVETDLYNPVGPGSRLGVSASILEKEGLPENVEGLHFHSLCESSAEDLVSTLERFEKLYSKYFPQLKWINMGGGHLMTRAYYNVDLLIKTLKIFREKYGLRVILEPGSAIAWQTGDLHCRVLDVVEDQGVQTAILDVSFAAHAPDTLEMPYRPEVVGGNVDGIGKYKYRLGGLSCLAGDFLEVYGFEKELKAGDFLQLKDMMHYTTVKTTMFNGVKHPHLGILDKSGHVKILRSFTYEDFKKRLG